MSANYDVIVIFLIDLEQSGTQTPDTWSIIPIFWLIAIFCLTKTEKGTKKTNTALIQLLWIKVLIFPNADCLAKKCWLFSKKMLTSAKLRGPDTKSIFSENTICVHWRTKFQVPSIILTNFGQGVILLSTTKRIPQKPTQITSVYDIHKHAAL